MPVDIKHNEEIPNIPFPDDIFWDEILNRPAKLAELNPDEGDIFDEIKAVVVNGHFIDDALDTATKQILGEFTFGASGALKIATDENNGVFISPTGILQKVNGETIIALYSDDNLGIVAAECIQSGVVIAKQIFLGDWLDPTDPLDTFIACGKHDFDNTDEGWIIGIDHSNFDKPAFFIGNAIEFLNIEYIPSLSKIAITNTMKQVYRAGEVSICSLPTSHLFTDENYTKYKVFRVGRDGNYNVHFHYAVQAGGTAYYECQVGPANGAYNHDEAKFTDQKTDTGSITHEITNLNKGDYIKIFCKVNNAAYFGTIELAQLLVLSDLDTYAPIDTQD